MGIFANIFPEISVLLLALMMIFVKLIGSVKSAKVYGWLSVVWLAATSVLMVVFPAQGMLTWGQLYYVDRYATFFKIIILITAMLVHLAAISYVDRLGYYQAEFFAVLNFALLGMMIFSAAGDFTTLYIGLELMTISFIILICFLRKDNLSTEAGMKYLILSAMSSAVMLFGMSIIYGFYGTTVFAHISKAAHISIDSPYFIVGLLFLLSGFAFKVSAVPFHMWAPDIYQAAPTPVAGFLAVGSKAAALALLTRLLLILFPAYHELWAPLLVAFALLSVIFGNLVAIPQKDVKRMLAYSSIAQIGYLLLGILAASHLGVMAMMYYITAYVFANTGAFIAVGVWEEKTGSTWRDDYPGMSKRSPFLAAAFFVFLVSLGGLPPMAGFIGKFLLFTATIDAGYLLVALIALLMSMVSVYYYFRVVRSMYITTPKEDADMHHVRIPSGAFVALVLCVAMTVVMGLFFGPIMDLSMLDARSLFM